MKFYLTIESFSIKDKNIIVEFFILMPFDGSKEIIISKKEIMENEREWGLSLVNINKVSIKPYTLEKIDPNQYHLNIFGVRKIKFGNLYKISFVFPKEYFIFSDNISLRFYQYFYYCDIKIKNIMKSFNKSKNIKIDN